MSKDAGEQRAPDYGYVAPLHEPSQTREEDGDSDLSDLLLDKFWPLSGIATLAISLFNARQLDGFVMFMGFMLGAFLGLVALPAILASALASIPAAIISSTRGKPFKKAFKPIFTALLYLFWLVSIVGWIINLSAIRR